MADKLSLNGLPAIAELWLAPLLSGFQAVPQLTPLPKYPAVRRDLSLLVTESVRYEQIESLVQELKLDALEAVDFVTTYRGKPLEKGSKSVTFTLAFRKADGTFDQRRSGRARGPGGGTGQDEDRRNASRLMEAGLQDETDIPIAQPIQLDYATPSAELRGKGINVVLILGAITSVGAFIFAAIDTETIMVAGAAAMGVLGLILVIWAPLAADGGHCWRRRVHRGRRRDMAPDCTEPMESTAGSRSGAVHLRNTGGSVADTRVHLTK